MRLIAILVALVLISASTCAPKPGEGGRGVPPPDLQGETGAPDDGIPEAPQERGGSAPVEAVPDLPATADEIAAYWPGELPQVEKNPKWTLVESRRTADNRHFGKTYLTNASTHEALRIYELQLSAKGFEGRQVDDPENFARQEFSNGKVLVVVIVNHDKESGKNKVAVTAHFGA